MRKLEKKNLDEMAKLLVKADAPLPRDIESIIANPALFDAVQARVRLAAGETAQPRFLFGRTAVASLAGVVLIGAVAFAFVVLDTKPVDVADVPAPQMPKTPAITTKFSQSDRMAGRDLPQIQPPARADRISNRPDAVDVKIRRPRQSAAQQIRYEGDGDFYALSYAGDPNETERGGRIVRVDIPRSTLFAMGVDVPLENESGTVKADLLIGSDGVTRAIRVVK